MWGMLGFAHSTQPTALIQWLEGFAAMSIA